MAAERSSRFHTTQWSLIAALPDRASGSRDPQAQEALAHLCDAYWRPLYTFARYSGYSVEDAQDLTQGFLARVLERGGLGDARPDRGRFRSYLLGAMKHFMSNTREQAEAKKRGGGRLNVRANIAELESSLKTRAEPITPSDADRAFDRTWAQETTAAAVAELRREWTEKGKSEQFAEISGALTGVLGDRAGVAERLGITENALAVAVHRLRQRYASLVREAVARTVATEADVDDELGYLVGVLREK